MNEKCRFAVILKERKGWLDGDSSGERANLIDANLFDANLTYANLTCANLTCANLTDANLQGANLKGANLQDANLQDANLQDANLQDANLQGANLQGADFVGCVGDMVYIKSMQCERYPVVYTADVLQIGCRQHPIADWWEFDDKQIIEMDGREALKWWRAWKPTLRQIIHNHPAKPTGA